MTDLAARVLEALRALGAAPVYAVADRAEVPVNVAAVALRQLAAEGLARRGEDRRGVVTWAAVAERRCS